jgi:transcription termination factor Rho
MDILKKKSVHPKKKPCPSKPAKAIIKGAMGTASRRSKKGRSPLFYGFLILLFFAFLMEMRVLYEHFYVHGLDDARPKQQTGDVHDRQEKQASIQKLEGVPQQINKPVSVSAGDTSNSPKVSDQTRSNKTAPVTLDSSMQTKDDHAQSKKAHKDPEHEDQSASEDDKSVRTTTKSDSSEEGNDDTEIKFRKGGKIGGKHVHAGRKGKKGGGGKGKGNKGEKSGKERGKGRGEKGKGGGKGDMPPRCACAQYAWIWIRMMFVFQC